MAVQPHVIRVILIGAAAESCQRDRNHKYAGRRALRRPWPSAIPSDVSLAAKRRSTVARCWGPNLVAACHCFHAHWLTFSRADRLMGIIDGGRMRWMSVGESKAPLRLECGARSQPTAGSRSDFTSSITRFPRRCRLRGRPGRRCARQAFFCVERCSAARRARRARYRGESRKRLRGERRRRQR